MVFQKSYGYSQVTIRFYIKIWKIWKLREDRFFGPILRLIPPQRNVTQVIHTRIQGLFFKSGGRISTKAFQKSPE